MLQCHREEKEEEEKGGEKKEEKEKVGLIYYSLSIIHLH